MADEPIPAPAPSPAPETAPAAPPPDDHEGRISELAKANKELKAQLKAIEDAKKSDEDAKLLKKGEYETLLKERNDKLSALETEHGTAKQQLEAYEKVLKAQLDTALKGVADEKKRETVKKLIDGKPLADQVALLPEVLAAMGTAPSTFGTPTPATAPQGQALDQKKGRFAELIAKEQKKEPLSPRERLEKHNLMAELGDAWNAEQAKQQAS